MKIKHLIKELQSYPDHDKDIIVAIFDEEGLTKQEFKTALKYENLLDWSDLHNQLWELNNTIKETQ